MIKNLVRLLLTVSCLYLFTIIYSANLFAVEISVIVNKNNPIAEISLGDLVKICKLEKQHLRRGEVIHLVMPDYQSREMNLLLKIIYRYNNAEELKKYLLSKMFKGEVSQLPKFFSTSEDIRKIVGQTLTAIGFIDSKALDSSVNQLRIDGKVPGEAGYPLKMN